MQGVRLQPDTYVMTFRVAAATDKGHRLAHIGWSSQAVPMPWVAFSLLQSPDPLRTANCDNCTSLKCYHGSSLPLHVI